MENHRAWHTKINSVKLNIGDLSNKNIDIQNIIEPESIDFFIENICSCEEDKILNYIKKIEKKIEEETIESFNIYKFPIFNSFFKEKLMEDYIVSDRNIEEVIINKIKKQFDMYFKIIRERENFIHSVYKEIKGKMYLKKMLNDIKFNYIDSLVFNLPIDF